MGREGSEDHSDWRGNELEKPCSKWERGHCRQNEKKEHSQSNCPYMWVIWRWLYILGSNKTETKSGKLRLLEVIIFVKYYNFPFCVIAGHPAVWFNTE